ncbi:MAG: diguanylate cyclase with and sensor [Burkholderiaceae bacterium]|nr:diguanylate cyclase with and sensor [Burkholderiaceae bacterium]
MNSELLSEVALALVSRDGFGERLSRVLKSLCTGMQLSRAYVFFEGQERATMGYIHEWCAEGVPQQWLQDVPYAFYLSCKRILAQDAQIIAPDTALLPGDLLAVFEQHGIRSVQVWPIIIDDEIAGFSAFDVCWHSRHWTAEEIDLLKAASALVSAFCEREVMRAQFREEKGEPAWMVEESSIHDAQTGVYNRRYVFNRLVGFDAEYARLGRNFCISLLDIDDFDRLDEQHGQGAADFILKEFASIISSTIRPYDLVGCYREGEFIIVSVNASAHETGYLIQRIVGVIKKHVFNYQGQAIPLAFSHGIADSSEFAPENMSVEKMVALAENRLQQARHAVPDAQNVPDEPDAEGDSDVPPSGFDDDTSHLQQSSV